MSYTDLNQEICVCCYGTEEQHAKVTKHCGDCGRQPALAARPQEQASQPPEAQSSREGRAVPATPQGVEAAPPRTSLDSIALTSGEPESHAETWKRRAERGADKIIELTLKLESEFQRGQEAMAEKAGQYLLSRGDDIGADYVRSLAGAATTTSMQAHTLTLADAEKEGITKEEFNYPLTRLYRWQAESLKAFRDKFGVEANCRALDAIDALLAERAVAPPREEVRGLVTEWRKMRNSIDRSDGYILATLRCAEQLEAALAATPTQRCEHGVWLADHCYQCAATPTLRVEP